MNELAQKANDPNKAEALRLLRSLIHVEWSAGRKWNIETYEDE